MLTSAPTKRTLSRVLIKDLLLHGKDWSILSAHIGDYDTVANAEQSMLLQDYLTIKGYTYLQVDGRWEGHHEQSFLILDILPAVALTVGFLFGQETILTDTDLLSTVKHKDKWPICYRNVLLESTRYLREVASASSIVHCPDGDLYFIVEV